LAIYEKKRGKLPLSQGIAKHPTSTVIPTHNAGIYFVEVRKNLAILRHSKANASLIIYYVY